MSYAPNTRKKREWGGQQHTSGVGSAINKKSALSAAYAELGKELTSGKLRSIGTYTLGRPIGEGTYGKVRLGTHRLTGVRVAIKQVPKAHSSTLTREIHHHRRLHHPNIMQLYEVLASESYIWMVTELCAGGELYDYLVERGTMPEPEARRIFGQLCMAVAYIHDRGIVHRDLKLENVLLDERCNVKLGDFGFTREFEGKKLMETFCGTTGYAAPEMLAGRRYTGEEVDVWSLGIILYALVCGALPFDDDDDSVMKDKILKGDFELPDVLSEECLDLITKILQQDPTARPTIKDILRHPWFTKSMAPMQMETVNEDVHDVQPLESVAESSASDSRFLTAKSGMLASSPNEIEDDQPTSAPLSLKHRNESQTTIKRQASASSDASRIATGTSSKSNSAPLPTHSESSEASGNTTEDTFTPMMAFSSPLEKRPSQSSSRGGHHRTPSRTKRRSSGGLSDHHPPSLDLKPVDYIALLELSTPAIFSTILEQNLLHQLSGLGMDVGQIVHSVVNEACDASGAMWWILKKKAEE
ncbi:Pkinase-domain-containing protein, partial [Meira miltonrushii]